VRTERVPFVAFGWLDGWSDAPPRTVPNCFN